MHRKFASKRTIQGAYKRIFGTEDGRAVLEDLDKRCPLLRDALNIQNGVDVEKLLVEQGRRDVLVYIYKMINEDFFSRREDHAIME